MGNCIAAPGGLSYPEGGAPATLTAKDEAKTFTELVAVLNSGSYEQKLAVLHRLTRATAKTDDECAAARYSLIQEEDVLGPLTQLLRATQRPALRAIAAQVFCNLSYACIETHEAAHTLGGSLEKAGEGLRGLIRTEVVRDGPLTACQALSNLSRAPELVHPVLVAIDRLNSIANHLVMSSACDLTVKASFAQFLLNASLHSVVEVQQLDSAGGLAAVLQLLDDPKGNLVVHERALCALHNLIRAHQLLLSCSPPAPCKPLSGQAYSGPTLDSSPCSTKASHSRNHSGNNHSSNNVSSNSHSRNHSGNLLHPCNEHTVQGNTASCEGRDRRTTASSMVDHLNRITPQINPHAAAAAAAPGYAELLRLPQVQTALQRQLRRPPLQGGTGGSSNCRFLAAKVVQLLVGAEQQQYQKQKQQQQQQGLQAEHEASKNASSAGFSYSSGAMAHKAGSLAPLPGVDGTLSQRGSALSNRDCVAGSLKHMAMSQLLEALQHALLQTPPDAPSPAVLASRFQPQRSQQHAQQPSAAVGRPYSPIPPNASSDSVQPLNKLRLPASPHKGSPGGGTPRSARTSSCVNGGSSSSPYAHAHSLSSLSMAGGLGSSGAWVGLGGASQHAASVAALPIPQPPLYCAHEQLLEALVGGLWGLCVVCCRPPRGHLPVLAQGTADRLVVLISRRGPNAPPMLHTCANMLCLMSGVGHARKQLVSAAAVPALVDLLAAAFTYPPPNAAKALQSSHSNGATCHLLTMNGSPTRPASSGAARNAGSHHMHTSHHIQQQHLHPQPQHWQPQQQVKSHKHGHWQPSQQGKQQQQGHWQPQQQHADQQLHRHQQQVHPQHPHADQQQVHPEHQHVDQQAVHPQQQHADQQLHRHQSSGGSNSLPGSATKYGSSTGSALHAGPHGSSGVAYHSKRQLFFGPSQGPLGKESTSTHQIDTPSSLGDSVSSNEEMWGAAAAAAKALRNMAVDCPSEVLSCPRAMPQLLAALTAHLPCSITAGTLSACDLVATARADVQRQCLTALISLTRSEPAATCQAVLDGNGCTTIAQAIHLGLQCGTPHGTQVAAWSAALLCQLYISPLEDAAPAILAAVHGVIEAQASSARAPTQPELAVSSSVVLAPTAAQQTQQQQQLLQGQLPPAQGTGRRKTWQPPQQHRGSMAMGAVLRGSHANLRSSLAAKELGSLLKVAGPLPDVYTDPDQSARHLSSITSDDDDDDALGGPRYGASRGPAVHAGGVGRAQHASRRAGMVDTEDDVVTQGGCSSNSSASSLLCESGCVVQLSASSSNSGGISETQLATAHGDRAWGATPQQQQQQQQQQQGGVSQQQQQEPQPHCQHQRQVRSNPQYSWQQPLEGSGETEPMVSSMAQLPIDQQGGSHTHVPVQPHTYSPHWDNESSSGGAFGTGEEEDMVVALSFLEGRVQQADPAFLEGDCNDVPS